MEDKKDLYSLPVAAFTFGKNGQPLPYLPIPDLQDIKNENVNKNNDSKRNNSNSFESKDSKDSNAFSNNDSEKRFSFKNILKNNQNNKNSQKIQNNDNNMNNSNKNFNLKLNNYSLNNNNFVFIDKEDSNSSYLKMILYAISYMKKLNNYFIIELQQNKEQKNSNIFKVLYIIKDILLKIDQIRNIDKNINGSLHINNIINIEQIKDVLSNLFKHKKKFLKNAPDDPIDFLFIIINILHSIKLQKESDDNCYGECFGHKNLWINISRVYECECKAKSNQSLNKNNYFIDIPINSIFKKKPNYNFNELNGKLFTFYKEALSKAGINVYCPKYGDKCKMNKVHYKIILKNCPSYFIFNLENDYFKNNALYYQLNDVLKSFILIPHRFNANDLFEVKKNNNKSYELIGIIFLKISKVYTCMFKQNDVFNYYDDNLHIIFNNYYDIIIFSIKNGLIPISLFYQYIDLDSDNININKNNINVGVNYDLSKEQLIKLEKYEKNTNNLNKNLDNKIRTRENIISDNCNINYKLTNSSKQNRNKNPSLSYNHKSSRFSGSINSFNSNQKSEYICTHCERINKIENKICFYCGFNNKPILNSNNDISSNNNKNFIKNKVSLTQENEQKEKNNELGEIEDEYKNIDPHVLKYFDMPRPYIPSKKTDNKISTKQSPKTTKNKKIPINNKNNIIKLNSPHIYGNSQPSTIENNIFNNLNSINNSNRSANMVHKKRNSDNNNFISNNNYYSELNNNQLNINLKINNNNNYNIFDFSDKKSIINLESYPGYNSEKSNFNDNKILKKINLIKNKKIKLNNINNNNNINNKRTDNNLNFNLIKKMKIFDNNNNYGIYFPNQNWVCEHCLNENNRNASYCFKCKNERNLTKNNSNNHFNKKINLINEENIKRK